MTPGAPWSHCTCSAETQEGDGEGARRKKWAVLKGNEAHTLWAFAHQNVLVVVVVFSWEVTAGLLGSHNVV